MIWYGLHAIVGNHDIKKKCDGGRSYQTNCEWLSILRKDMDEENDIKRT